MEKKLTFVKRLGIVVAFVLLCVCQNAFSESPAVSHSQNSSAPGNIQLLVRKDFKLSANGQQIYTLTVRAKSNIAKGAYYLILFYVDGRTAQEFNGQTLPFTFNWNFTGQPKGKHEVRVEVLDEKKMLLGEAITDLNL